MTKTRLTHTAAAAIAAVMAMALAFTGCESSDSASGSYWQTETKKPSQSSSQTNSGSTSGNGSSGQSSSGSSSSKPSGDSGGGSGSGGSGSGGSGSGSGGSGGGSSGGGTSATDVLTPDEVPFSALKWRFGGKNGASAKQTSARIGGLSMSKDHLSYRWTGPTLASWGLANSDPGALACLFVQKTDGTWVGGKFDWISTSRTTRDFININSGYGGWSLAGVPNPCACAFVIVSSDCKKRTNVISGRWTR